MFDFLYFIEGGGKKKFEGKRRMKVTNLHEIDRNVTKRLKKKSNLCGHPFTRTLPSFSPDLPQNCHQNNLLHIPTKTGYSSQTHPLLKLLLLLYSISYHLPVLQHSNSDRKVSVEDIPTSAFLQ